MKVSFCYIKFASKALFLLHFSFIGKCVLRKLEEENDRRRKFEEAALKLRGEREEVSRF